MAPKGRKKGDGSGPTNADDDDGLDELVAANGGILNKSIVKYGVPFNIILALCLGYMHFNRKGAGPPAPAVHGLSEANFSSFVGAHPEGVLVDFYIPGCQHCHTLAPEFEAAAQQLREKKPTDDAEDASGPAMLASVNGEAEPGLAKKYNLERYPTVLWFKKGESVQELPPMSRTAAKISEFVAWVQQPAIVEFPSRHDFSEAVPQLRSSMHEKSPPVVVGFAGEGRDGLYEALESVAEKFRGKLIFLYVHVGDAAAGAEVDLPASVLRSYAPTAEADVEFGELAADAENIQRWVEGLAAVHKEAVKAAKA